MGRRKVGVTIVLFGAPFRKFSSISVFRVRDPGFTLLLLLHGTRAHFSLKTAEGSPPLFFLSLPNCSALFVITRVRDASRAKRYRR